VIDEEEDDSLRVIPPTSFNDQDMLSNSGAHAQVDTQAQVQMQDQSSSSTPIAQPTSSKHDQVTHLFLNQAIARYHPIDQIMSDIGSGVQNRFILASFYERYSFLSSIEPTKIDEALKDPYWVNAMHEELNNFTRNQVWELVERPKNYNVIGTN
jgi:hypothetical protein